MGHQGRVFFQGGLPHSPFFPSPGAKLQPPPTYPEKGTKGPSALPRRAISSAHHLSTLSIGTRSGTPEPPSKTLTRVGPRESRALPTNGVPRSYLSPTIPLGMSAQVTVGSSLTLTVPSRNHAKDQTLGEPKLCPCKGSFPYLSPAILRGC